MLAQTLGQVVRRRRGADMQQQAAVTLGKGMHARHGSLHSGAGQRRCLDLAQLDAMAAQLDLVIQPAVEKQHAVAQAAQVAGAVHACIRTGEAVRLEPLLGQVGTEQITERHAGPADPDFALFAVRHGLAVLVQQMDLRVGDGATQWHRAVAGEHRRQRGPDGGFGRAVHVPDLTAALRQPIGQRARQGFATDQHAQVLQYAVGVLLDEHAQQGRRALQDAGMTLAQQLQQCLRIVLLGVVGQQHAGTADQRQVELQPGDVERQRGHRTQHIVGLDARLLVHAGEQVDQVAVRYAHAFRLAGGAGGIQHVGHVVCAHHRQRRRAGRCGEIQRGQRQHFALRGHHGGHAVGGPANDVLQLGMAGHVAQPFGRKRGVQRHVGRAAFQHAQQGAQQMFAARHGNTDPVARSHPARLQGCGNHAGATIQLGVAERAPGALHRHALRGALRLPGEQQRQCICTVPARRHGWRSRHRHAAGHGRCRKSACLRRVQQLAQQGFVLADPEPDGASVELAGCVVQVEHELLAVVVEVEKQVPHQCTAAAVVQAVGEPVHRCRRHPRVEVEDHRGQRRHAGTPVQRQRPRDAHQGCVLMFCGIQHGGVGQRGQFGKGRCRWQLQPQRQGVDPVADQRVVAAHRLTGKRQPDGEIMLPREARHQHAKAAQQQAVQTHASASRSQLQGLTELGIERMVGGAGGVVRALARWSIQRQRQGRWRRAVKTLPEIQSIGRGRRSVARLLVEHVATKGLRRSQRRHGQTQLGAVAGGQFAHEHRHRPAVHHQVMRQHVQAVPVFAQPHQGDAHQRRLGGVERHAHLRLAIRDELRLGVGRMASVVQLDQGQRQPRVHPLALAVCCKAEAERLVPRPHRGQRALERGDIERTAQVDAKRFVEGQRGLLAVLAGQPFLQLALAQRHRLGQRGGGGFGQRRRCRFCRRGDAGGGSARDQHAAGQQIVHRVGHSCHDARHFGVAVGHREEAVELLVDMQPRVPKAVPE